MTNSDKYLCTWYARLSANGSLSRKHVSSAMGAKWGLLLECDTHFRKRIIYPWCRFYICWYQHQSSLRNVSFWNTVRKSTPTQILNKNYLFFCNFQIHIKTSVARIHPLTSSFFSLFLFKLACKEMFTKCCCARNGKLYLTFQPQCGLCLSLTQRLKKALLVAKREAIKPLLHLFLRSSWLKVV